MGETNSPAVAHVGYDITPLSRVKFNSLEWRNIVTHGHLKENLYFSTLNNYIFKQAWALKFGNLTVIIGEIS